MLKRPAILCAMLLFATALGLGVVHLFDLRLDQGDIYPPYSSLRNDPLGASVLYESLEQVPGVSARRYYEETLKIDDGRARTLFLLGLRPYAAHRMPRAEFDVLQRFVYNGGRVVIAYFPEVSETWSTRRAHFDETNHAPDKASQPKQTRPAGVKPGGTTNSPSGTNHFTLYSATNTSSSAKANTSSKGTNDVETDDEEDFRSESARYTSLHREWGFGFTYHNLETNDEGKLDFPSAKRVAPDDGLPRSFAVHTALCFTDLTNGWTTAYERDGGKPVLIERKFGAGSVVLVADSYPFSNEALFKDRSAALLAWLLGGGRDAIFDEAHLGVVEEPGVATLMRRYQLHGLFFGLLAVAGLFIWKNNSSLVPPVPEEESAAGPVIAGRDSAAGFVNLLRRGIPPEELINVCFAEWKKSGVRLAGISPAQRREAEQIVEQQNAMAPRQRRPIDAYRSIAMILKHRK